MFEVLHVGVGPPSPRARPGQLPAVVPGLRFGEARPTGRPALTEGDADFLLPEGLPDASWDGMVLDCGARVLKVPG